MEYKFPFEVGTTSNTVTFANSEIANRAAALDFSFQASDQIKVHCKGQFAGRGGLRDEEVAFFLTATGSVSQTIPEALLERSGAVPLSRKRFIAQLEQSLRDELRTDFCQVTSLTIPVALNGELTESD